MWLEPKWLREDETLMKIVCRPGAPGFCVLYMLARECISRDGRRPIMSWGLKQPNLFLNRGRAAAEPKWQSHVCNPGARLGR